MYVHVPAVLLCANCTLSPPFSQKMGVRVQAIRAEQEGVKKRLLRLNEEVEQAKLQEEAKVSSSLGRICSHSFLFFSCFSLSIFYDLMGISEAAGDIFLS